MDVKDEKVPYELLVRFNDDGTPKGGHVQFRRVVTLGDEVLKEEIGAAEPIDLADFPSSAIMKKATKDAIAEVSKLNNAIKIMANHTARLEDEGRTKDAKYDQLNEEYGKLNEQMKAAQEHIAELEKNLPEKS